MRASYSAMVARKLGGILATRPAAIAWPGGIVSFTFDDFPKTALSNGGAILQRHGARGTYYTAFGLAGTTRNLGPMFDIEDVRSADREGHEIACHTLRHIDLVEADKTRIVGEAIENAAASAEVLNAPMTTFAFPYGAVSITAKRALADRFSCLRGTGRGINHGRVDRADLLATEIYGCRFDPDALCGLIDRNRELGGWLIFYTHDVDENPSEFGCQPGQLDRIVAYAAQRSPVLTVRDVAARLGFGRG